MSSLIKNYNKGKIFLSGNRFFQIQFTNGGSSAVTISKGTLFGRITIGQKGKPFESDAEDGSEQVIGVLGDDYSVPAGGTTSVLVCDGGVVDEGRLVFAKTGDSLDTAISGTSVRDCIQRNTIIQLVTTQDLTGYDNQ